MATQVLTDSPNDVLEVGFNELFSLVDLTEEDKRFGINRKQKYFILNCVLDYLGMDANNELLLGVLSQPRKELVIACAGSGKTTMAHIKIIFLKVMSQLYAAVARQRGEKFLPLMGVDILFLVYNTHNVDPVVREHMRLCAKLNAKQWSLKFAGEVIPIQIDTKLNAMTFHSLAKSWVDEYAKEFGIAGFQLVEGEAPFVNLMATSAQVNCRKAEVSFREYKPFALYQTYVLCKETMVEISRLAEEELADVCPRAELAEIDGELLVKIFAGFEKSKNTKRYLSFTDYLTMFHRLLLEMPKARERVAARYDFFIADEYQDFNNIMIESLRLLVGEKNLFCIGDDDQAIYGFRGVDIEGILNFRRYYEDGKVYTLSINRRCKEEIVKAASFMVNHNQIRYQKLIHAKKPGGVVKFHSYITEEGAARSIVSRLSKMRKEDLGGVVICYKNRVQSAIMAYELFKAGIPSTVSSGVMPMENLIFRDFLEVMNLLTLPNAREYHRFLSYVTCLSDEFANSIVDYDGYRRIYRKPLKTEFHFKEEDFGKFKDNAKFQTELEALVRLSRELKGGRPMCEYMPELLDMYLKNHINWRQEEDGEQSEVNSYFTKALTDYYSSELSYREFFKEHHNRVKQLKDTNDAKKGVLLSTFHGLKGLEKEIVIGIGLDEKIYPAIALIDSTASSLAQRDLLVEEEMRLFYVLLTRAKEKVYLYYQKDRPSRFVQMLMEGADAWKEETPQEVELTIEEAPRQQQEEMNLRRRFGGIFGCA